MSFPSLALSADGAELPDLVPPPVLGRRTVLGVAGVPGAGKSRLAAVLTRMLGDRAAYLPMDGFHLADVELDRQGLRGRKGAPETFDAWGYAALLERVRARTSYPVYAPGFERDLEQPIAGAIAVGPDIDVVVTEGNYLLLDEPGWCAVRAQLDDTWYVVTDEALRRERLVARHIAFGKSPEQARSWVEQVDEPNARLVEATRGRADRVIDLTRWAGQAEGESSS